MSTKKRRLSIKLTQENWEKIHHKAEFARKNLTDYVTHTCLGKEIVIIADLAEVHRELKAVGKNLNKSLCLPTAENHRSKSRRNTVRNDSNE